MLSLTARGNQVINEFFIALFQNYAYYSPGAAAKLAQRLLLPQRRSQLFKDRCLRGRGSDRRLNELKT